MNLLCLCPTYGRPSLVANLAACFLAQDYRGGRTQLLIYDDAGQLPFGMVHTPSSWGNIFVLSTHMRAQNLPVKYNSMLRKAARDSVAWDAVVLMDDDDIFLPWHLSSIAAALAANPHAVAAKPSRVYSLYQSTVPSQEDASGRFWATMGIRMDHLRAIKGFPETGRIDFDQQMLGLCQPLCDSLNYCTDNKPSFIYRWQSTQAHHCSGDASHPGDETWYRRVPITEPGEVAEFLPRFDAETQHIVTTMLS